MARKIGILEKEKSGAARKAPGRKSKKSRKFVPAKTSARRRKKPAENLPLVIGHPPPPGEGKRGERRYLAYLLRQAQAATRLRMERALADLGVTPPQFIVLPILNPYPGLSRPDPPAGALRAPRHSAVHSRILRPH